jgi:hypothetical protein
MTKYWFPAKRYGWGWGLPTAWQGWLVLAVFAGLIAAGAFLIPPAREAAGYVAYVVLLSAILTGVCWLTGERPRWRWGEDD